MKRNQPQPTDKLFPTNQRDFVLALAAERAVERVLQFAAADLAHFRVPTKCELSRLDQSDQGISTSSGPFERPGDGKVPDAAPPDREAALASVETKVLGGDE